MRPDAAIRLIREKLLREMGEEIFTVASPGRVQVDQEDLEAAEDVLAVQESRSSHRKAHLHEFVRGMGTGSSVRDMPEYEQFLDAVMRSRIPGIHPDDVLRRWKRMFPNLRLTSGQISQLHAALLDDGALDQRVYESKMEADTIHEDIGKVWMDYGHYGGDPDAPTDHDTSSWSPLDDVEDDPDESLLPTYVSMKRAEEGITRGVKSLTKMELRSMIREEIIDSVRTKSARRK